MAEFVSTHSRLKAAELLDVGNMMTVFVSTHSRLKAADASCVSCPASWRGFNTQPPEGG